MTSAQPASVCMGIVAYNTPETVLLRTLTSCIDSTFPVQVVVLCNSPSNDYQEMVKRICERFATQFMGDRPNRGFGAGHNEIWKSSSAKYYICCNPDVVVHRETVASLVQFAESKRDAVLLMPKIVGIDGRIQPVARQHLTPWRWMKRQVWRIFPRLVSLYELCFDYDITQPVEFVTGCFFMVSREKMSKLGGFDEEFFLYAEEADLSRRAEAFGRNYFLASALVTHLWSTHWAKNPSAVLHELRSLVRYFIKHRVLI